MFGDSIATSTVGEVAEIQGGLQVSAKRSALPVEVPYLRVANAHRGRLNLSEVKTLRATAAEVARTLLEEGDLLFVEGHANLNEVGRVSMWRGELPLCVHQNHLIRGRLERSKVVPIFAAAWLNTEAGAAHFRRAGRTTSGLNTISAATVRSAPIPVPALSQQHEFAKRVAQVREQRESTQQALAADDELFASLQSRAFRGEL
jgi:type I restriction enzyme S subunit